MEWKMSATPQFSAQMLIKFFCYISSDYKSHCQVKKKLGDICKERTAMFINNEHTGSSGLSENFPLFSLSGKSHWSVFQELNIHEKSFPNILNHKDDILHF